MNVFELVEHRPYPVAPGPWVLGQRWHELLFAHWHVKPEAIQRLLPDSLEIETFDGAAWLAIVPFTITDVRPRGLPGLPVISNLLELNVRTYVRCGDLSGVYFFSLDASNPLAARAARYGASLPYLHAQMELRRRGDWIGYRSRRTDRRAGPAELHAYYRPVGPGRVSVPGTLEYFLFERYRLLADRPDGNLNNIEIHHGPWYLQPAEYRFEENTMAEWLGIELARQPDHVRFVRFQDVYTWPPRVVEPPVADPARSRGRV